jgi:acyl-CoA synthetase (AMP-forming)/AMP-acid ligase II
MASRVRIHRASELWQSWESVAHRQPRAVAIIETESGISWTRAELRGWAQELAGGPLAAAAGECVGFSLPNSAEWVALFAALQSLGAAAVPLDASLTPAQQDSVAAGLHLRYVWRDGALRETAGKSRAAGMMRVGKLTSGSTGAARIVRCSAAHLVADGRNIIRTMRIEPADRNLALIPLGHSYGLGNLVAPLLLQGTAMVCAKGFVPRQVPGWIQKHRATVLPTVPAIVRLLAALPGRRGVAPLRLVISAGARLPGENAIAFAARFGLRVHNFYGSSETGGISFDRSGHASAAGRSVGLPLDGVKVDLTSRGRVRVQSESVAAGRRGLFTLPDLGRFNSRGELEITGRVGSVANLGGRNLHPREIENRIAGLRGVTDTWVQVLTKAGRDYLVAAVESARSPAEIAAEFGALVADWQRPRFWLVLPKLPRTSRGKLDVAALRARLEARRVKSTDARA